MTAGMTHVGQCPTDTEIVRYYKAYYLMFFRNAIVIPKMVKTL